MKAQRRFFKTDSAPSRPKGLPRRIAGCPAGGVGQGDIEAMLDPFVGEEDAGALLVDYDFFRQACSLKARENARNGRGVQLALIAFAPGEDAPASEQTISRLMDEMGNVIRRSLRQEDLYTRVSGSQFLLLIQAPSPEYGQLALDRVRGNFQAAYPRLKIPVEYRILPMPNAALRPQTAGE